VTGLVVVPVGAMAAGSLRADVVETRSGARFVGRVTDRTEETVTIRVSGVSDPRVVRLADVAREGRTFTLAHYGDLLARPGETDMLVATLALALASTLLAFVLGLAVGVLLGATDLPLRDAFETLLALPLALPPVLLAIAAYRDLLAIRPEFLRAVLVFGFSLFPLVALFTIRALRSTPAHAWDAARVQAPPREAFLRVVLGPALPGAAAGALLVFTFVVADFAVPDFLGVTTAKNTITVYANAVFRFWEREGNAGAATAAGMPATALALLAFLALAIVERRRGGATSGPRPLDPMPLGRARVPALLFAVAVFAVAVALPAVRHGETAAGEHFGDPVASGGLNPTNVAVDPGRPASLLDGLRKGVAHDRAGECAARSLLLAGGGALLATLLALALAEAGRARPRLDLLLAFVCFLPIAVPPMVLAVGWVSVFGRWSASPLFPILLMAARVLPFAAFAVREARRRIDPSLLEAADVAGLAPTRRTIRVVFPLLAPAAAVGLLVAFLFGLRETDAVIFTRSGAATLPVLLYRMIHFGKDVQVAALALLWMGGLALLLVLVRLLLGRGFRLLP